VRIIQGLKRDLLQTYLNLWIYRSAYGNLRKEREYHICVYEKEKNEFQGLDVKTIYDQDDFLKYLLRHQRYPDVHANDSK